jgi:hypothetical protein
MQKSSIAVVYNRTTAGMSALAFAADLVQRMQATRLTVFVREDSESGNLLSGGQDAAGQQLAFITTEVRQSLPQLPADRLDIVPLQSVAPSRSCCGQPQLSIGEHHLLVDDEVADKQDDCDVLVPFGETGLLARGNGPVLLPFGHGESPFEAARLALELAAALQLEVVFYHTTWTDPEVDSKDPLDHVCDAAKAVQARLEKMAAAASLQFRTIVECADDVVEGLLHCAMREQACLIAMSRSFKTVSGCYVDHALVQSPAPLLIAARKGGAA